MNASWMIGAWIVFTWESVKLPAANSFVSKSLGWMICQLVIAAYRQEIDAKIFPPLNVCISICADANFSWQQRTPSHRRKNNFMNESAHSVSRFLSTWWLQIKPQELPPLFLKWKNSSNSSGHKGLKCWEKFLPHFYFHYCTSHKILAYRLSFVKLCHEIVNISTCFHCVFTE